MFAASVSAVSTANANRVPLTSLSSAHDNAQRAAGLHESFDKMSILQYHQLATNSFCASNDKWYPKIW